MMEERDLNQPEAAPESRKAEHDLDPVDAEPDAPQQDEQGVPVNEQEPAPAPGADEPHALNADLDPTHDEMGLVDPEAQEREKLAAARARMRAFEDLSLAQMLGEWVRDPGGTWQLLQAVASTTPTSRTPQALAGARHLPQPADNYPSRVASALPAAIPTIEPVTVEKPEAEPELDRKTSEEVALLLGIRVVLVMLAWYMNSLVAQGGIVGSSSGREGFGAWCLLVLALVWLGMDLYANRKQIFRRNRPSDEPDENTPAFTRNQDVLTAGIHPVRVVLFVVGVGSSLLTVIFTRDNQFTVVGFFAWMTSIVAFSASLATDRFLFDPTPIRPRIPEFWKSPTFYALLALIIVGATFRLANLERTPPQMTSDHVEKLLDAQRVLDGNTQVFFPNNGGREAFQMYAMALLSLFPGQGINFTSLKFLSALEGIVTLPFLWWLGRSVVGVENRRLGNFVGLALAALVAVSGWHVALSRLSLRIVLTPLIASWLLIYLGRGMRDNNRDDFLKAGLVLGAGLYMYQAVRMLPVVVVVGVLIAVVMLARNWQAVRDYTVNLASLVWVSFVVFVPLFSFSIQFPDLFWRRTTGRILGDDLIQQTLEDGSIVMREPTIGEQIAAFNANLPILGDNIRDALLMFNYQGDVAWINNHPNAPLMDMFVGGLFVLGLAAWLGRIIRRRDVVDVLVPVMLFVMLLPSALSIAYPVENPSATRTSGALPVAYLIAAYPLALLLQAVWQLSRQRVLRAVIGVVIVGAFMLVSFQQNARTYFQRYHDNYLESALPYDQAGSELRAFNERVGSSGNSFMIAYPFWWDHRALGLEAGLVDYPNGVVERDDLPGFMYEGFLRGGRYNFNPEADIMFFFSVDDIETLEQLQAWFPSGQAEFRTIERMNRSYGKYLVPAPGSDAFLEFLRENDALVTAQE